MPLSGSTQTRSALRRGPERLPEPVLADGLLRGLRRRGHERQCRAVVGGAFGQDARPAPHNGYNGRSRPPVHAVSSKGSKSHAPKVSRFFLVGSRYCTNLPSRLSHSPGYAYQTGPSRSGPRSSSDVAPDRRRSRPCLPKSPHASYVFVLHQVPSDGWTRTGGTGRLHDGPAGFMLAKCSPPRWMAGRRDAVLTSGPGGLRLWWGCPPPRSSYHAAPAGWNMGV